ncbi:hypothetical protein U6T16_07160 [Cutibacterium acnes]
MSLLSPSCPANWRHTLAVMAKALGAEDGPDSLPYMSHATSVHD